MGLITTIRLVTATCVAAAQLGEPVLTSAGHRGSITVLGAPANFTMDPASQPVAGRKAADPLTTAGGSWSHPGWWARCREPSSYCLDKNHCLCLPPLPRRMRTYQMNLSTVTYCIGNASGMDSQTELEAEARFGNVGVGWQIDGIPKQWAQGLEVVELAEAKRLKALRPEVRVLVSRQTEVGTQMWNSVKALIASDPTDAQHFFTSCRGRPCSVRWETDASYFFNWSSPALRDW